MPLSGATRFVRGQGRGRSGRSLHLSFREDRKSVV
jgi:hypothetical protein